MKNAFKTANRQKKILVRYNSQVFAFWKYSFASYVSISNFGLMQQFFLHRQLFLVLLQKSTFYHLVKHNRHFSLSNRVNCIDFYVIMKHRLTSFPILRLIVVTNPLKDQLWAWKYHPDVQCCFPCDAFTSFFQYKWRYHWLKHEFFSWILLNLCSLDMF